MFPAAKMSSRCWHRHASVNSTQHSMKTVSCSISPICTHSKQTMSRCQSSNPRSLASIKTTTSPPHGNRPAVGEASN